MRTFLLNEPYVTQRLLELQAAGWIAYDGRSDHRDYWRTTEQAHRLAATKVIGRISAEQGADILRRLVEQARTINREPERSERIEAIFLFGSLLTGSDDGTVGDVDVVVQFRPRALPPAEREVLLEAEVGDGSYGLRRWSRGINIIKARLRAVSRSVSIHDDSDLRLPGLRYKQVYAFDAAAETEVTFSPEERSHTNPFAAVDLPEVPEAKPFERAARPWPIPAPSSMVTIDRFDGYLAQHLWQNGSPVTTIAETIRAEEASVDAYLSVCAVPTTAPTMIVASLSRTMGAIVPLNADYRLLATVGIGGGTDHLVIYATDPESHQRIGRAYCRKGNDIFLQDVRYDLVPVLIAAADALGTWRDKLRPRLGGLTFEATAYLPAVEEEAPAPQPMFDFRPLLAPMMSALDAAWVHPRGSAYEIALVVELQDAARSKVRLCRREGSPPRYERLPKPVAAAVNDVLRPFRAKWALALDGRVRYTLTLPGTALQNE